MARKLIGQVVNTFGLRGALKVVLFTDCPEIRFKEGNSIEIKGKEYKITECRIKPGLRTAIVSIEGFEDINDSLQFIHQDIYADVEALPGTIYIDELIGRDVINSKGEKVGTVKDVVKINTRDYFVITMSDTTSRYMPLLTDVFCKMPSLTPGKVELTELGEEALK